MKNISFLSENFQVLEVKFSIYLNRHVSVMPYEHCCPFSVDIPPEGRQKQFDKVASNEIISSLPLTHLSLASHKWDLCKRCRSRLDAAGSGV